MGLTTFAILVCASRWWFNYRHRASVAHVAHYLIEEGVPADNIYLLSAGSDVSVDPLNPLRGYFPLDFIQPSNNRGYNSTNSIHNTVTLSPSIVPRLSGSDVTVASILGLLEGRMSPGPLSYHHLSSVGKQPLQFRGHPNGTLLLWFAGHGGSKYIKINAAEELQTDALAYALTAARCRGAFARALVVIDSCKAASLLVPLAAVPDTVAIAATSPFEESQSAPSSPTLGLPIHESFSRYVLRFVSAWRRLRSTGAAAAAAARPSSQPISAMGPHPHQASGDSSDPHSLTGRPSRTVVTLPIYDLDRTADMAASHAYRRTADPPALTPPALFLALSAAPFAADDGRPVPHYSASPFTLRILPPATPPTATATGPQTAPAQTAAVNDIGAAPTMAPHVASAVSHAAFTACMAAFVVPTLPSATMHQTVTAVDDGCAHAPSLPPTYPRSQHERYLSDATDQQPSVSQRSIASQRPALSQRSAWSLSDGLWAAAVANHAVWVAVGTTVSLLGAADVGARLAAGASAGVAAVAAISYERVRHAASLAMQPLSSTYLPVPQCNEPTIGIYDSSAACLGPLVAVIRGCTALGACAPLAGPVIAAAAAGAAAATMNPRQNGLGIHFVLDGSTLRLSQPPPPSRGCRCSQAVWLSAPPFEALADLGFALWALWRVVVGPSVDDLCCAVDAARRCMGARGARERAASRDPGSGGGVGSRGLGVGGGVFSWEWDLQPFFGP